MWREGTKRADGKCLSQAEAAGLVACAQSMWGCLESGDKLPGVDLALAIESVTGGAIAVEDWATRPIPAPPASEPDAFAAEDTQPRASRKSGDAA